MSKDFEKEPEDKKNYELSFLLRDENSAKDVLQLAAQHGAESVSEGPLKKISMAYAIDHLSAAYFGFLSLAACPSEIKALERDLRGTQSIARFLIVALPALSKSSGAERRPSAVPQRRPRTTMSSRPSESRVPKPISNEALEKKIEEILQ